MSLLTIPPEVRLRISRFLFEDSTLTVAALNENESPKPEILVSISRRRVPVQITSTCRLLRQESVGWLLPSTHLVYETCKEPDSSLGNPVAASISKSVLSRIKYLTILFANSGWNFLFDSMVSLRHVQIELSKSCGAMKLETTEDKAKQWLDAGDGCGLVAHIKRYLLGELDDNSTMDLE